MKWIAPAFVYLEIGVGLFLFDSAWGALIGFHLVIVATLLIARPKIPVRFLITNHNVRWLLLSVVLCGSSGISLYVLWNWFGAASDLPAQVESLGLNQATWIPFILYFTLVNPWIEEYFWRGYLGSDTTRPYISDFLYAGFHGLILLSKVQTLAIFFALATLVVAGWFWRQIARKDQGLLAPVLGHMAADLAILLAVYSRV